MEAVAEAGCSSVFDLYYLVPNFSAIIGSLYRAIFGNAVAIYANICLYFSFFFIYVIIYLLYKQVVII